MQPRQPADPTAQRVAEHADSGGHAVQAHQPMLGGRPDHVAPRGTGRHRCGASLSIDADVRHSARAQQDRSTELAEPDRRMTEALRRDAEPGGGGEAHRSGHVVGVRRLHHKRGALVGEKVPGLSGLVPPPVLGGNDAALDVDPKRPGVDPRRSVHPDLVADRALLPPARVRLLRA